MTKGESKEASLPPNSSGDGEPASPTPENTSDSRSRLTAAAPGGLGRSSGITQSGVALQPVYSHKDLNSWDPQQALGEPGEFPFTRGIYPTMYRGKFWTMRQ
jgi:methylmalonyl-CoA mutase N-terminal domain/subunit